LPTYARHNHTHTTPSPHSSPRGGAEKIARLAGDEELAAEKAAMFDRELDSERVAAKAAEGDIARMKAATTSIPVEVDAAKAAEAAARAQLEAQQAGACVPLHGCVHENR